MLRALQRGDFLERLLDARRDQALERVGCERRPKPAQLLDEILDDRVGRGGVERAQVEREPEEPRDLVLDALVEGLDENAR